MNEQPPGIALCCTMMGNVSEVLVLSPELRIPVHSGMPFARLAASGSLAKALSFLLEIRAKGAAFDWEINIAASDEVLTLHFAGGVVGEDILITGSESSGVARKLYEELILINNEQTNTLRATLKEKSETTRLYDEVTRLNNEQANLQRELAKKNAELERLYAQAQRIAITDLLTDIYNRRGFFELGEREFQRTLRYRRPLSVIMYDLDHFKAVNDTYGHAVGDLVLKETAQRCRGALRKVDIIGRYGGEEFVAMLPDTDLDSACRVAERMRRLFNEPIRSDELELVVTASLGVAEVLPGDAVLDDVLRAADLALYQAKESGRNCVRARPAPPEAGTD